jgi:hypothetical protein
MARLQGTIQSTWIVGNLALADCKLVEESFSIDCCLTAVRFAPENGWVVDYRYCNDVEFPNIIVDK